MVCSKQHSTALGMRPAVLHCRAHDRGGTGDFLFFLARAEAELSPPAIPFQTPGKRGQRRRRTRTLSLLVFRFGDKKSRPRLRPLRSPELAGTARRSGWLVFGSGAEPDRAKRLCWAEPGPGRFGQGVATHPNRKGWRVGEQRRGAKARPLQSILQGA